MTDEELIQALREDAEWAQANEWETPITLGDNLTEAAGRLEMLIAEKMAMEVQIYQEDRKRVKTEQENERLKAAFVRWHRGIWPPEEII